MKALQIIEAETPKKALRIAARTDPALDEVDRRLGSAGWTSVGGNPHQWQMIDKWQRRGLHHWPQPMPGDIVYNVWWDEAAKEWVFKKERKDRDGYTDFGFKAFKTGRELLFHLKTRHFLREAESPKRAMRAITNPDDLEMMLKRLKHDEEVENTPRDDSWQPGQRVRRIRHEVFGPRPFGGDPNDIGDTGTIIRFLRRLPAPQLAEYVVSWDRRQLGSHYTDHRRAEAIPGEFDQLDQWGHPPVRRAH
jgi:hypothetical protein